MKRLFGVGLAVVLLGSGCLSLAVDPATARRAADGALRLNEIQVLGSHNSYKQAMSAANYTALAARNPTLAESLQYSHPSLQTQLALRIRKIELDVFYDPEGSLFTVDNRTPGSQFPVLHVQNLDDRSNCPDLIGCLRQLQAWSQQHPNHVPVFISFNAKDAVIDQPGFIRPLPFDEDSWMAMDAEIRAVLGDRLITPAEIVMDGKPLWPLLDEVRGRFLLILDEGGSKRATYASRWRERAMFANLPESEPGAAILIVNDPIAEFDRIQHLVRQGYIVRTRADADTREARSGDTRRRDSAFASGAQLISTDYYRADNGFGTGYRVEIPGGMRCNPLLRAADCRLAE